MEKQILFAGFGGQGVLSMAQFLAYAAMEAGKFVAWVPSYGAEMRGGTANCLVTIADEEISSPITENPLMAVIMNRPSLEKFEQKIQPGGTLDIEFIPGIANRSARMWRFYPFPSTRLQKILPTPEEPT